MAIQISSCTVIDNDRNINAGIGTFTELDVPPTPLTFSPTDGATGVEVNTNVVITFNQQVLKGTGNITFREGSAGGTIIETIAVSSGSVSISGASATINLSDTTYNYFNKNVYVVVDDGAFINQLNNGNAIINTYNFTTVAQTVSTFTPSNGSTNQSINTDITLTFTTPPTRGTGTITLRRDSAAGTILESFDAANSNRISISGSDWILNPTAGLPEATIFLVIPDGAILGYTGTSTYSFTTLLQLGAAYEGGFLICKSSPIRWVVAPSTSEVFRSWYCRDDASTRAQQVSGCTGWFVPTCTQLTNPGYSCRTYWDSYDNYYWSSTERNAVSAWYKWIGGTGINLCTSKTRSIDVRAFRCVTY